MQTGYVWTTPPGQHVNSLEILMARRSHGCKQLWGPPRSAWQLSWNPHDQKKPWMQTIVGPKYTLLATNDLRFPILTPNWMMSFLSSTGWQVTNWFILLRGPSTNRELMSSIFIYLCWVCPHKIFNYILARIVLPRFQMSFVIDEMQSIPGSYLLLFQMILGAESKIRV
jgi:hypothetical protein